MWNKVWGKHRYSVGGKAIEMVGINCGCGGGGGTKCGESIHNIIISI